MGNWTYTMGVIGIMIVVLGLFAIVKSRKQAEIREKHPGYPKGYWLNQGFAIGIAIGAGIGVPLGNIALGIGVGIAIGAAIGSQLEKQHEDEIRPMTDEERKLKKQTALIAGGTLLLGLIVFVIVYFGVQ